MPSPKKPFVNDKTIVTAEFLTSIFGGDDGYATANPPSPFYQGHLHDGGTEWGHAPLIDLTEHVTGRLVIPSIELKSLKFTAAQATPLTSSLFWTIPVPNDAYSGMPEPMYLNIYWSANGPTSPGNVAFRVDWIYCQVGQNNMMPPSVIDRGPSAWTANTNSIYNPLPTTFRFKSNVAATVLNINDSNSNNGAMIPLTLPSNLPGSNLGQFCMLGLEISSAPTVTLTSPMSQVSIFAIDVQYYSQTLGSNTTPTVLSNDPGIADF